MATVELKTQWITKKETLLQKIGFDQHHLFTLMLVRLILLVVDIDVQALVRVLSPQRVTLKPCGPCAPFSPCRKKKR